jgi:phosphoserine phosphatase RsbU/P
MGTVALGIRNVLCVPLRLVRYVDKAENVGEERRIGVLYLDSREKGSLLSESTRAALETLATEAAVAIENARLYRETMEKARMEQEMRIAAEIQQALLPKSGRVGPYFERRRVAPVPLDRRRLLRLREMPEGAARLRARRRRGQGAAGGAPERHDAGHLRRPGGHSDSPSQTIARVNLALYRRGIESRFVTLMYGVLDADGGLTYCNAGHNPPLVIGASVTSSGAPRAGRPDRRVLRDGHVRRGDAYGSSRATG